MKCAAPSKGDQTRKVPGCNHRPAFRKAKHPLLSEWMLSLFYGRKGAHIFSGASTPISFNPFFSTTRVSSASFRRAACTFGSSPLMRQAV